MQPVTPPLAATEIKLILPASPTSHPCQLVALLQWLSVPTPALPSLLRPFSVFPLIQVRATHSWLSQLPANDRTTLELFDVPSQRSSLILIVA